MNAGNYQEFMAESDAILRQLEKTGIPVSVEKTRDYANQLEIMLVRRLKLQGCQKVKELKNMAERETQRFEDWPKTEKTKKPSLCGDVVKGADSS